MELSYDPVVPHLGTQSSLSQHTTETFTYPCLLLHIFNNQEGIEPVQLSTDECMMVVWYIHTKEYYAVIKKNETMTSSGKWIGQKLSEASKTEKDKQHMLSFM